ncbi:MAG: NADH-quinone oxidoreductase subunit J [Crocinitomicaceae bacterium]|nr:NADH-quinone oxidoreductase subunit J [Crocinitomicaceae bacterium]
MTQYVFYFLAFLAILSALMMVFSKNPIHSVLYLVLTFFAIAGHYLLLNAQFLAVVHIVVYAGAIMVLFLYVLMLINQNQNAEPVKTNWVKFAGVISGGLLLLTLVATFHKAETIALIQNKPEIGLTANLGKILFNEFALPFEISSVLLLSAMIGAILLSKKEVKK